MELLNAHFKPPVSVFKQGTVTLIEDTQNTTLYQVVAHINQYLFKDENDIFWLTVPPETVVNGKVYYPKIGDILCIDDVERQYFVREEVVLAKANAYFSQFIDTDYGILKLEHGAYFYDEERKGNNYALFWKSFKSKIHHQIKESIHNN